jgi:hypothetical protein
MMAGTGTSGETSVHRADTAQRVIWSPSVAARYSKSRIDEWVSKACSRNSFDTAYRLESETLYNMKRRLP